MNLQKVSYDYESPTIIEEIIAKYAVGANLFQLGSINSIRKIQPLAFFFFFFFWLLYPRLIVRGLLT